MRGAASLRARGERSGGFAARAGDMAKVTLKNIKKVYDKNVVAVQEFNLEIADKEFIVLVGPSKGSRHRDGVPELRTLSSHDGL